MQPPRCDRAGPLGARTRPACHNPHHTAAVPDPDREWPRSNMLIRATPTWRGQSGSGGADDPGTTPFQPRSTNKVLGASAFRRWLGLARRPRRSVIGCVGVVCPLWAGLGCSVVLRGGGEVTCLRPSISAVVELSQWEVGDWWEQMTHLHLHTHKPPPRNQCQSRSCDSLIHACRRRRQGEGTSRSHGDNLVRGS